MRWALFFAYLTITASVGCAIASLIIFIKYLPQRDDDCSKHPYFCNSGNGILAADILILVVCFLGYLFNIFQTLKDNVWYKRIVLIGFVLGMVINGVFNIYFLANEHQSTKQKLMDQLYSQPNITDSLKEPYRLWHTAFIISIIQLIVLTLSHLGTIISSLYLGTYNINCCHFQFKLLKSSRQVMPEKEENPQIEMQIQN